MPRISRRAGVALVCAGALACSVVGMLLGVLAAGGHHPHLVQSRTAAISGPPPTENQPFSVVTVASTAAQPPAAHAKPKHHPGVGKRHKGDGHHHHRHLRDGDGDNQGDS